MAKWLLLTAAVQGGQWLYLAVILAGSLLAAAYVLRVLLWAFLPTAPEEEHRPLPRRLGWPSLALALLGLLLGVASFYPLQLAAIGAPVAGTLVVGVTP